MKKKTEMNPEESGFLPFDPIVIVRDVAKRWLLVLMVALAVGVGTYIMADMRYQPVYRTVTTYVVTNRGSNTTVYANLSSTSSLAPVFTELLNSSLLRREILNQTGETSFDGTISAAVVPETNLVTVTVTSSSPRTAFTVAQAIMDHHGLVTYQVIDNVALEVLQKPVVPSGPSNYADATGKMLRMMVYAGAAMVVYLAIASFASDKVRSGSEARKKLDGEYLGDIPHENKYKTLGTWLRHKKTSILITNPSTSFHYVENIRNLRRRVEQHMAGGKVLMVTSLLENEGKSTVAVNLAMSMSQKRKRVLLIDCDLRKPACYAVLEQKKVPYGLRDVLTEKAQLSDALILEKKSKLLMLLETRGTAQSGDLLTSERMQALLKWARREFDFVVLDLPPMAEVSDAESMAEFADASLLVVRQNAAVAPAINKAVLSLESGKAKLLGCVLNNAYSSVLSFSQNYGYGYGYGGYGNYGRKSSSNPGK